MLVVPLIERKRDGGALTPESGRRSSPRTPRPHPRLPDVALLMAVLLAARASGARGLTDAMLASGQRLAFDSWATPGRQALDGRRRRQGVARAGAARGRCGVAVR